MKVEKNVISIDDGWIILFSEEVVTKYMCEKKVEFMNRCANWRDLIYLYKENSDYRNYIISNGMLVPYYFSIRTDIYVDVYNGKSLFFKDYDWCIKEEQIHSLKVLNDSIWCSSGGTMFRWDLYLRNESKVLEKGVLGSPVMFDNTKINYDAREHKVKSGEYEVTIQIFERKNNSDERIKTGIGFNLRVKK